MERARKRVKEAPRPDVEGGLKLSRKLDLNRHELRFDHEQLSAGP